MIIEPGITKVQLVFRDADGKLYSVLAQVEKVDALQGLEQFVRLPHRVIEIRAVNPDGSCFFQPVPEP